MSNLILPLGIESLEILSQTVDLKGNIIVDVKSLKTETPCHKCGKSIKKFHSFGETIEVRHLPILDQPVYLRIKVARYQCDECEDHPTSSESYD